MPPFYVYEFLDLKSPEMTIISIKMCFRCTIGFCSGVSFQKNIRPSFDGFWCRRFFFAWIRP